MDLSRKRVLVVDDHPGMLNTMRRALEMCGISGAHMVRSAQEAVARLRNMRYDIVLADYDLGPGPDGQQLLEHCRAERLLAPAAIFVMVTAERAYDRVMSAAEAVPDDYLVKPFTEEMLRLRLARALDRSRALAVVRELHAKGQHEALVQACDRLAASEPQHALELTRMKGDALLALKRHREALEVFEKIVQSRPLPWARLGIARAYSGLDEIEQARRSLTELLADAPEFLAAYDCLADLHRRCLNDEDAKAVLNMAIEVSPNILRRHKVVGDIALRMNDLETAERALSTVVRKGRHAFTRSPDDHLKLSRIYMEREKYPQALDTLAEAKKAFHGSPAVKASACAVETLIHSKANNPREARRTLDEALAAAKASDRPLDPASALELAQACYLHHREHDAVALVEQIVANNHDDLDLLNDVRSMYDKLDRKDQGEILIDRCVNDAVSINNEGVLRAKNGDLDGAIELLEEAARAMPDNVQIVMNAAHSLIVHMQLHGLQPDKLSQVQTYLERVEERNSTHPKFLQVLGLQDQLLKAKAANRKEAAA